jgi:hypothetical protein
MIVEAARIPFLADGLSVAVPCGCRLDRLKVHLSMDVVDYLLRQEAKMHLQLAGWTHAHARATRAPKWIRGRCSLVKDGLSRASRADISPSPLTCAAFSARSAGHRTCHLMQKCSSCCKGEARIAHHAHNTRLLVIVERPHHSKRAAAASS